MTLLFYEVHFINWEFFVYVNEQKIESFISEIVHKPRKRGVFSSIMFFLLIDYKIYETGFQNRA